MANPTVSQTRVSLKDAVDQLKTEEPAEATPLPTHIPLPRSAPNSGLYTYSVRTINPRPTPIPMPAPGPGGSSEFDETVAVSPVFSLFSYEELRLDVDGNYAQMKASGQISGFKIIPAYWIANVAKTAVNTYEGAIWYKDGNTSLVPFTKVKIEVTRTLFSPQSATITFTGGGAPDKMRIFKYASRYFHPVNFEFDADERVSPVLSYNTGSHPNRPASLPNENLSIVTVYRRAGFDVSISGGGDIVPMAEALKNNSPNWSDTEMHDSMQIHWS